MILLHPIVILLYFLIGLGGITYLIFRILKKGVLLAFGKKQEKGWLDQELDAFKDKNSK